MSGKWIKRCVLSMGAATSMAGFSFGQYQDYASPQYGTNPPQRVQAPWWNSAPPAATPYSASPSAAAPYAYAPSDMPSVNPLANVRSHQQQMPVGYGSLPAQSVATPYDAYPTTFTVQQQHPVGESAPYAYPTPQSMPPQQAMPAPHGLPAQQGLPAQHGHSFYDQPAQNYWQQPDPGFAPKGAGCATGGCGPCHSGWYGGVFGMVMNRSRTNDLWLSYDINDIRDRVLTANHADFSTAGGAGAQIGHYFNCGRNSIQFVYWGLYPETSEANAFGRNAAGGIDRILHFDGLAYDAGTGSLDLGDTFFFNAERHRVQRSYDVHNLELNLLGHNFVPGCGSGPLTLGWLAGVRYLRFDEDFLFSSDVNDVLFTGEPEEVHYSVDVENNLVGFQFGGQANYCVGPRLNLFANTKVGVFGNHMSQTSRIYGSNGQAYVADPVSPYLGQDVYATADRNSYSMIGDLSVGGNWCVTPCWSINAGYRLIGVTGVALSTNQVPGDFIAALDSIRTVNSNGCLILHGAFAGINYCY